MSWLGSGISQITGQISNFTKEVLTEGTEEVNDHVTELKLAQDKIKDLEYSCASQRAETERIKKLNDELCNKLQTSELQISKVSSEYRNKLDVKESEVKSLKQQQNELLDVQGKMASHTLSQMPLSKTLDLGDFVAGDGHDFDDVISSQYEINRLRSEVQRLDAECRHWKQAAAAQELQHEDSGFIPPKERASTPSSDLQEKIQVLERKLGTEIDERQNKLAALQNAHSHQLNQVKRQLKAENDNLQEKIRQTEESLAGLEKKVLIVEEERDKLQEELTAQQLDGSMRQNFQEGSLPSSTPNPKASCKVEELRSSFDGSSLVSIEALQDELSELKEQVSQYEEDTQQFEVIKSDWELEKEALEEVLVKLRMQLKKKEEELLVIQTTKDKLNADLVTEQNIRADLEESRKKKKVPTATLR